MSEYKKEIAAAVTISVVVVLALAGATSYLLPLQSAGTNTGPVGHSATTTGATTTNLESTTTTTTGIAGAGWNYWDLTSAIYNSSEVKPHITGVYYYAILAFAPPNDRTPYAEVFVVGAQVVSGNWTTGYNVTYTGRQTLNVTVQFTSPSTYNVTGMVVTNLADKSSQISFNATQREGIQAALENSTVKADLNGMSYYIYHAFAAPNPDAAGTGYWVQIAQVNGNKAVQVQENSATTEVLNVITFTESLDLQP